MTLADEGWICAAPGAPTRWQLTGHIQVVAHSALSSSGLRQRAGPALERLREATGESVGLTVPDIGRFVVIEILESRHMLRTVPHVGMVVTTHESATGRAVLAHLCHDEQIELLGREPDAAFEQELALVRQQGYFVSEDDVQRSSINIAAPIFEVDGRPVGAVILSAPRARLTPDHYARVGAMVLQTARELSLARPQAVPGRAGARADA